MLLLGKAHELACFWITVLRIAASCPLHKHFGLNIGFHFPCWTHQNQTSVSWNSRCHQALKFHEDAWTSAHLKTNTKWEKRLAPWGSNGFIFNYLDKLIAEVETLAAQKTIILTVKQINTSTSIAVSHSGVQLSPFCWWSAFLAGVTLYFKPIRNTQQATVFIDDRV